MSLSKEVKLQGDKLYPYNIPFIQYSRLVALDSSLLRNEASGESNTSTGPHVSQKYNLMQYTQLRATE